MEEMKMGTLNIPIIHTETIPNGMSAMDRRYDISDIKNIIRTVQTFTTNIFQEAFIILGVADDHLGLTHIRSMPLSDPSLAKKAYLSAIAFDASGIIAVHNSPIRIEPPEHDIEVYKELKHMEKRLQITLLDHIILTGGMIYGIHDTPIMPPPRWKGLQIAGCSAAKQPYHPYDEDVYIVSAYTQERTVWDTTGQNESKEKPFTIGV